MKRNSYSNNDKENKELYGEEVDYYIDSLSNLKDSINNSEKNSENNIEYIPRNRNPSKNNKNEQMGNKKMNSKEQYIKSLEDKIHQQDLQISKLIEYKNLCESTIKQMNPLISLPLKNTDINDNDSDFNINDNNDYMINNKKKRKSKKLNLSFNENRLNSKNLLKEKIIKNRANSELDIGSIAKHDGNKYDKLYSKYIKIINDYKNLSNNSVSTNEYTRLKTQYNELKTKNKNLLKQIQNERNKSSDDIRENEIIKNLKEQIKTFREELVLSQAMVNSLRAEIEQYAKNNKNKKDINNDINYNDYDDINNIQNNNDRRINNKLKEENDNLKYSLKNNSLLLKKVLEENNRLREQNKDNQLNQNPQFDMDSINRDESIMNIKNKLSKYEDKFDYFNDYINNIKNRISDLLNDLKSTIYGLDSPETSSKFSKNFIDKLQKLKNDILKLKDIDRFNLDSTDDEECIKQYMNLVKLLLNGLEEMKLQKSNNLINDLNNYYIKRNDNIYRDNLIDNTQNHLKEILEILKNNINENGTKQLISDALNIIDELSNLYKIRNKNGENDFNNVNGQIMEKEKELEYIKKLLLNQNTSNKNKQLTYTMDYFSPRLESKNKSGYYFMYE